MTARYDLYETPVPSDREKKEHLHARLVTDETVNSRKLAELIHSQSSLTTGDIESVIILLKEALLKTLKEGKRVHLDGIGYFQLTVSCPPVTSVKEIRAESVKFKSVVFRPEKQLKQELAATKFVRAEYKKHSKHDSNDNTDRILTVYFATHNYITRMDFERICSFTRTTANRRIKQLVEEGKLRKGGIYRSPVYEPAPGFYGKPDESDLS